MKVFGIRPALGIGFLLVAGLVLGFMLMPVFPPGRYGSSGIQCLSNVKKMAWGHMLYTSDYDDRYPPVEWQPVTLPYVREKDIYHCPVVSAGDSGYAYNRRLAAQRPAEQDSIAEIAMLFEANDLRLGAVADRIEPLRPPRHEDRLHLAFADGHARRMAPLRIAQVGMNFTAEKR